MVKTKNTTKRRISAVFLFFLVYLIVNSSLTQNTLIGDDSTLKLQDDPNDDSSLESIPTDPISATDITAFPWWDAKYEYRILIEVSPNQITQDHPAVEMYLNFSQYLEDNNIDPELNRLNTSNLILVEQRTDGYSKIYPIQYDHTGSSTRDQGELAWVIDESFDTNKSFFIYFCTGPNDALSNPITASPYSRSVDNYPFRLYHQGFENENFATDGAITNSQDYPGTGPAERSTSISGVRGDAGLIVRGNRWPALNLYNTYYDTALTTFDAAVDVDSYSKLYITYSFEIVDITPASIEILGLGVALGTNLNSYDYYQTHWGSQTWGDSRDLVSTPNIWYYRGFDIRSAIGTAHDLDKIFISNDDDATPLDYRGSNWDDISIWNVTVDLNPSAKVIPSVMGLQQVSSNFQISVLDLEGLPVPGASVSITNDSQTFLDQEGTTNDVGMITFTNVSITQKYNITVNYTGQNVASPEEFTIAFVENVELTDFDFNITVNSSLWAMDFKVSDWDSFPVDNGFVVLYDDLENPITNVSLDENGECTVRYQNVSTALNYTVWLDTSLYSEYETYASPFLNISSGIVSRTYSDRAELLTHSELINTNFAQTSPLYANRTSVNKLEVFGFLTEEVFGDRKIGYYEIEMINFSDNIIAYEYDAVLSDDSISMILSSTETNSENLTVNYTGAEMKALQFYVRKTTTTKPGYLNISYYARTSVDLICNITRYTFNISALGDDGTAPLSNAICIFRDKDSNSIANITTTPTGLVNLTYFRWTDSATVNYSLQVSFINQLQDLNQTIDPQLLSDWDQTYEFVMDTSRQLDVLVDFQNKEYITHLNVTNFDTSVRQILNWGDSLEITLHYTLNQTGGVPELKNATLVSYSVLDEDFGVVLTGTVSNDGGSTGIYTLNFDSSVVIGGFNYYIDFTATKEGYPAINPDSLNRVSLKVNELNTECVLYDTSDMAVIDNTVVEKKWGEVFNISLVYSSTLGRLDGATTSIECDFISLISMNEVGSGSTVNYTYQINTSLALSLGQYLINIEMDKENYKANSTQFFLKINPIPTTINSTLTDATSDILQISRTINETDSLVFDFTYYDAFNGGRVSQYDTAVYTWQKFSSTETGTDSLYNTTMAEDIYQLDFDTVSKEVGIYILVVTLEKENYEQRQALIVLTIEKRIFSYEFAGDVQGSSIQRYRGSDWNISIIIEDSSRNFIPLSTATVQFSVPSLGYVKTLSYMGAGRYTLLEEWDAVKSFFVDDTYTSYLTIQNDTFTSVSEKLTLLLPNRTFDVEYQGDLASDLQVTKIKSDTIQFTFQMRLTDRITGNPIEDANITLTFRTIGVSLVLTHVGDGVYEVSESFANVEAFTTDVSFQGNLVIEIENYDTTSVNLVAGFSMEEIFAGVPTFYFIIGVGAVIVLVGSIVGYRIYQNASIPEFVKLITAAEKTIKSNKDMKPENITVSAEDEVIEKFGEYWKFLDLDLSKMLKGDKPMGDNYTDSDFGGL